MDDAERAFIIAAIDIRLDERDKEEREARR